jgi:hypothetical protein
VLFAATLGDTTNIWELSLSVETGTVSGPLRQRTFGAGIEVSPSTVKTARGTTLAFASLELNVDVWALPLGREGAAPRESWERLTRDLSAESYPAVAAEANKLVFVSARSDQAELHLRDLATRRDVVIASSRKNLLNPSISADGSSVVFWELEKDLTRASVFAVASNGGIPEKLCEMCGPPTALSSDGGLALLQNPEAPGQGEAIAVFDMRLRRQMQLIRPQSPATILYAGRFSPDSRWVSFHAALRDSAMRKIFIATGANPGAQWIPVTDGTALDREAHWSPGGDILYFLSDRDGFRCVWARRLSRTRQPISDPFAVQHFHHARLSLEGDAGRPDAAGLSVARDRLIVALRELTGNIWFVTNVPIREE